MVVGIFIDAGLRFLPAVFITVEAIRHVATAALP
jgi:hypothetical protein